MKSKKDYSILRQPISEENITQIAELIVLRAIKTHCGYDHKEEDTLRLLYNGISSHEIAAKLDICFQTVYLRRKRMQNKYLQLKIQGGI